MSAAKKIQDELPGFSFGLWNRCPQEATVAWGARGIADRGLGFSLLRDRQTMVGLECLREPFSSLVLNKGPINSAIAEAKRLRDGFNPRKDLSPEAFTRHYWDHLNELQEKHGNKLKDWMFQKGEDQALLSDDKPLSRREFDRLFEHPSNVYEALGIESDKLELYFKRADERDAYEEDNPPSPPPPPTKCENEEEPCDTSFRKIGKDEYANCYLDFDCWICDTCGNCHSFDWPEDEGNPHPGRAVIHTFEPLIGNVHPRMFDDKAETFTLFDDSHMKIMGDTNGSHGYVYAVAYPTHQIIDLSTIKPSSKHPGYVNGNGDTLAAPEDIFWSGDNLPPMPGEEVYVSCNSIGKALAFGHIVMHNYLTLNVLPLEPPEFYLDNVQGSGASMLTNVMGSEIR